ncbi:MAG: hypothetical protein H0U08_04310 [Actinobacteria bacterium]|nr:hypothetical protein [Actinomycetota bacterium]
MLQDWNATERMLDSGGFESGQRMLVADAVVEASRSSARWLGTTYWLTVGRVSRGTVRTRWRGDRPSLTLLGGITLLSFGPPALEFSADLVSCRYTIEGGLLASRAGGSVTLAQRRVEDGFVLSVVVEEYLPRLAARAGAPGWTGALYAKCQSPFHAAVSRQYFDLLASRAVA